MKRYVSALAFFVLSGTVLAAPPSKDREAILNFAGSFEVDFSFEEVKALSDKYQLKKKPYTADAIEIVKVVEDQLERIALQHGFVDFRWPGKKAVTAFLDGSVELMNEDQLRDMRYWSDQAARQNNPDFTVSIQK